MISTNLQYEYPESSDNTINVDSDDYYVNDDDYNDIDDDNGSTERVNTADVATQNEDIQRYYSDSKLLRFGDFSSIAKR